MYRHSGNSVPVPSASQAEQPEDLSPQSSGESNSFFPSSIVVGSVTGAGWPPHGNRLLLFCDIVLKHTDYPHAFRKQSCDEEEDYQAETKNAILVKNERITTSPLNSVGESAGDSLRSCSSITGSELAELEPEEYDKEAYDSVSCHCGQPYAGRSMIECDRCLIWFHMTCEQVNETHVPELFHCKRCKSKKKRKRPSTSTRKGSKKKRRTSATATSTTTSTSTAVASEPTPPLLHMEDTGLSTMPYPLRLDENHPIDFNRDEHGDVTSMAEQSPSESHPEANRPSIRTAKKRGRNKSSSSGTSSEETSTSSSLVLSSQLGLNVVDVGASGQDDLHQSVPSTISASQPPPLLPCYATSSLTAASTESDNLVVSDHYASMNGDTDVASFPFFPSIPVLEPQIVNSNLQRNGSTKICTGDEKEN